MLSTFISEIKKTGLSRNNRYKVTLTPPYSVSSDSLQTILLYCDQAQLPGITLSTSQNRSFGEFREVPYEKLFDNCQLSFMVDTKLSVKRLFDDWVSSIQSPVSRKFNYYKNYTTDLKIEVQDLMEMTRYNVTLYECYPKTVSSIQLDYASKDIMKVTVTMQYKHWMSSSTEQLNSNEVISTNDLYNNQALTSFNPLGIFDI